MTTDKTSYKYPAYIVEVQGLLSWHTVKVFVSDDTEYAKNCATELLEMLGGNHIILWQIINL